MKHMVEIFDRKTLFRILLGSVILAAIVVALEFIFNEKYKPGREIAASLLVGAVGGFLYDYIQRLTEYIENLNKKVKEYVENQNDLINKHQKFIKENMILFETVKNVWYNIDAWYQAYKRFEKEKYSVFIKDMLHNSTIKKKWLIPCVTDDEFYEILITGFSLCNTWDGIHEGPITLLINDGIDKKREQYLQKLKKFAEKCTARRIVIIDNDNDLLLLKDRSIIEKFKETAGNVKTYCVQRKEIIHLLRHERLDDAAILDDKIFLQYDRKKEVVDFDSSEDATKANIVKKLFHLLDTQPEFYGFLGFN